MLRPLIEFSFLELIKCYLNEKKKKSKYLGKVPI